MPLLSDAWTARESHRHPYRWLATEPGDLLAPDTAHRLAETFPDDGYTRRDESTRTSGKQYRNFSREVLGPAVDVTGELPEPWRRLIAELVDPTYRARVAALLDQEPAGSLEVRLVRHAAGDWLGPHTDRGDKLFSHILYFNPGWQEEWGGCLEILDGDDPTAVVGRVVPRLGASALLAQASNSWHQVTAVSGTSVQSRTSLLVHGLR
ncbi:2OG-Fe(II) oxygenase family protein [Micromonospora sp. NPDC047074]|uniref:2OG-Fe(II) oxygenase family protein n=1 Tax=Micromonospora sp. NPDC047074 TaxID=3154339 RepID=UPI0033F7B9FD